MVIPSLEEVGRTLTEPIEHVMTSIGEYVSSSKDLAAVVAI